MSTSNSRKGLLLLILSVAAGLPGAQVLAQTNGGGGESATKSSAGEQKIATSSKAGNFTFILFYRSNDRATQTVYKTLKSEATKRDNAVILPIQVNDPAERNLVERFDAGRTPLPAVVALAPNEAVTSIFSQKITPEQFNSAIVTRGHAECIKALQNNRIVLLCVQPETRGFVPKGVREFQADREYGKRTQLVSIRANDPAETQFVKQLRLKSDISTPQVVFMAPPGVLLGTYDASVTHAALSQKLVSAGKCCTDKNCKHNRTATGAKQTKKR